MNLFHSGVPVFLTSVTLGEEIARGGSPAPEDLEKPLFYALLSTWDKELEVAKKLRSDSKRELSEKSTLWNRWFNQSALDALKNRIDDSEREVNKIISMARPLLGLFDNDSVFYVDGAQTSLTTYFANRLVP